MIKQKIGFIVCYHLRRGSAMEIETDTKADTEKEKKRKAMIMRFHFTYPLT